MKGVGIVLLIVFAVITVVIAGIYLFSGNGQIEKEVDSGEVSVRGFSLNRSYKNDMDTGLGDSEYFYFNSSKVVVELWGYDRSDVIDKEKKINDSQYEKLKEDILVLIEKYNILDLAKDTDEDYEEDDIHITDSHSSFSITIYYRNADDIKVTEFPKNYDELIADLEEVFADYI